MKERVCERVSEVRQLEDWEVELVRRAIVETNPWHLQPKHRGIFEGVRSAFYRGSARGAVDSRRRMRPAKVLLTAHLF